MKITTSPPKSKSTLDTVQAPAENRISESFEVSSEGSEHQEEGLELGSGATPGTTWKCVCAILIGIAILGGISFYIIPCILLLMQAAVAKLGENAVGMSHQQGMKRKRSEDENGIAESRSQGPKTQRLTHQAATAEADLTNNEIGSLNEISSNLAGANNPDITSTRNKLVGDISNAQNSLAQAQDLLAEWEAGIQQPVGSGQEEDGNEVEESHEPEDGEEDEEEEYEEDVLESFRPVLAEIHLDQAPEFASNLRLRLQINESRMNEEAAPELIPCVVREETPLTGSFNILFIIEFSDGVKWLLKIPATGTVDKFDQSAVNKMKNEVLTMQFLKQRTTIPLPAVYDYDTTFENVLNCPYIMMEMLEGTALYKLWYDESTSNDQLEERRARTLKDLANYMSQLSQFQFDKGGYLLFGDDGKPYDVGPMTVVDDAEHLVFKNNGVDYGKMYERGPFSDPATFFTRKQDLHEPHDNEYNRGRDALIRLLISWLPQGNDPKFVLRHPDYDSQNILVAEDGSVSGMIDWDGVCTVPHANGNLGYPMWLMIDWNPTLFEWLSGPELDVRDLPRYRDMYEKFMKESMAGLDQVASGGLNSTKISLIADCLEACACQVSRSDEKLDKIIREISIIAAHDPRMPPLAKNMMVPLIGFLTGDEEGPWKVASTLKYDLAVKLEGDEMSEDEMGWLRDGFAALCSQE